MTENRLGPVRRAVTLCATALGLVCMLAFSSTALATIHHPKGAFAPFAECPLSNPSAQECLVANTTSGEFIVGKKTVPISNTITLQGGTHENEETGELTFIEAENGPTLSKSPQGVPGGLTGLVNCKEITGWGLLEISARVACEWTFENFFTGVEATTELAASASSIGLSVENLISGHGTALLLPVKVHLENPFLGSECYIGSNAKPIDIELTAGTSGKVKGNSGKLHILEAGALVEITENVLVNNTFAAPEATGCGGIFSVLIDPIVNGELGLPAGSGSNTAILKGTIKQAAAEAVLASE